MCNSPPRDFKYEIKQTQKFLEGGTTPKLSEFSPWHTSSAADRPNSLSAGKHFSNSSQTAVAAVVARGVDFRNTTCSPKDRSTANFSAFTNALLEDHGNRLDNSSSIRPRPQRNNNLLANTTHGPFSKALSTTNMVRIAENDESTAGCASGKKVNKRNGNRMLLSGPDTSTRIDFSLMTPSMAVIRRNS